MNTNELEAYKKGRSEAVSLIELAWTHTTTDQFDKVAKEVFEKVRNGEPLPTLT